MLEPARALDPWCWSRSWHSKWNRRKQSRYFKLHTGFVPNLASHLKRTFTLIFRFNFVYKRTNCRTLTIHFYTVFNQPLDRYISAAVSSRFLVVQQLSRNILTTERLLHLERGYSAYWPVPGGLYPSEADYCRVLSACLLSLRSWIQWRLLRRRPPRQVQ